MHHPTYTHERLIPLIVLLILTAVLLAVPASAQAIKVTSAVPDTTEQGATGVVITIGGENFASGAKVAFYVTGTTNPGGIAVKSVRFKDSKTLEATIDVAADAQTSLKFDIQVKCNGRTGKGTELFKVRVPSLTCLDCEIVYSQQATRGSGRIDLMLMRKDGTNKTLLLAGASGIGRRSPRWAPDATWIAFNTSSSSTNPLQLIRNDGTGLTTVLERCSAAYDPPAWRPIRTANGYWVVYLDTRRTDGSCIVDWPYWSTGAARNLWAVEVNLGQPILAGAPVCLTCDLNAAETDFWANAEWSRDGSHLSMIQTLRGPSGVSHACWIFDVSFDSGAPVLGHAWQFAAPEYDPESTWPGSWANLSDSFVAKSNETGGTYGLMKYEIDLGSEPETLLSSMVVATGTGYPFGQPRWSPDDTTLVDWQYGSTLGIYVITLGPPFSMRLIAPNGSTPTTSPDWKPMP